MSKRLLAVIAAGLMAVAPVAVNAQSVSLAGGLALPVSDLKDGADAGYNAAIGLNFGAPLVPFGARIEGAINGFNFKNNVNGDVRILNVTANGIFNLGMPYLIGGLGYYNRRIKFENLGVSSSDSESAAGINIGGGIRLPLGTLSPFAEIRYHAMLGDKDKQANFQFIPITFGIQF
ncbi:MAG: hypothetical protein ABIU76_09970 [Gemmatimonadaceae bacterium]